MKKMEKKIELTPLEVEVIRKDLRGEFDPILFTDEGKRAMYSVIAKADALMDELHADDELGDSLIKWFWNKYKKQEGIKEDLDFNDDDIRVIFDR